MKSIYDIFYLQIFFSVKSIYDFYFFQMQLDEQTRLISERGMVLIGNEDEEDNDFEKTTEEEQDKRTRGIVSSDTAAILSGKQKADDFMAFFV